MRKILPVLLAMCYVIPVAAQNVSQGAATIQLMAKAYGDSVVLRWAPSSAAAWQALNTTGYKVLRLQQNSSDGKWTVLTEKLVPLPLDGMKKNLERDNRYAAIAAQALYGKNLYAEKKGMAPAIAQQADILNNRFALTVQCADYSAPVARAVALGWVDRTVTKGAAYIYKIEPASQVKDAVIVPMSLVVVNEATGNLSKPDGLFALAADRKAELQWPRNQPENYSGFIVERSEDGKTFRALHSSPFFTSLPDSTLSLQDSIVERLTELLRYNHLFIDSLQQNYQTYYYRIRGINAFAEWSAWSDAVAVSGRDLTPPSSVMLGTPEVAAKKTLRLNWAKNVKEKDFAGYYVYRSRTVDGNYSLLNQTPLPVNTVQFTDTGAFAHGPNFYIVAASDTAGNQNASLPVMGILPDTTAPHNPRGLQGRIDSLGLVHLAWQPNTDEDIKGYKLYFSHAPDQSFAQLTLYPEPGHQFTDSITLKTLTKKIYYRLVAVDQNNNHSNFSEILELKKPDLVPPTPPIIINAEVLPGGARLVFSNSASTDAISYTVVRKEGANDWKAIAQLAHKPGTDNFSFNDTTIRHGVLYQYAARTKDEDGLESPLCTPVTAQLRGTEMLQEIRFAQAVYDEQQKAVVLKWNYTASDPHHFVIYRAAAGGALERYRTLQKGTLEWKDLQVDAITSGYRYAIQAVHANNSRMTRKGEGVLVKN